MNDDSYKKSISVVFKKDIKEISTLKRLLIVLFPFMTFMGPYFSILGVNISHIYNFILIFPVLEGILKKRYRFIGGQISFFFIMIIYASTSLIWTKYASIGINILMPLITCLIAMMFVASLNGNEFDFFLTVFSFFTIIVMVIALYEIFTGNYLLFNNELFMYRTNPYKLHYPGVCFANPNDLGQYLLISFPIMLFRKLDKDKNMFTTIIMIAIAIFILINTYSRLSIISTCIIIMVYVSLSTFKKKYTAIRAVFSLSLIAAVIGGGLVFGLELTKYNIIENFFKINTSAGYFTGRSVLYLNALKLAFKNLIVGAGLGGSYAISLIGTHNMFLFIFADLGILWAVGFAFILVHSAIKLFEYKNVTIFDCHMALIMFSIIIIFPLFSSISSANEQRKIVWVFLGMIFATIKNYRKGSFYLKKMIS